MLDFDTALDAALTLSYQRTLTAAMAKIPASAVRAREWLKNLPSKTKSFLKGDHARDYVEYLKTLRNENKSTRQICMQVLKETYVAQHPLQVTYALYYGDKIDGDYGTAEWGLLNEEDKSELLLIQKDIDENTQKYGDQTIELDEFIASEQNGVK
ncbi:MAG: hypothetical protein H6765_06255 [Candidatus Peribacteria bacterium]|nr:MAG: hypothetical protein H6765_06255 [Candidatus Peribacteria bacterium]